MTSRASFSRSFRSFSRIVALTALTVLGAGLTQVASAQPVRSAPWIPGLPVPVMLPAGFGAGVVGATTGTPTTGPVATTTPATNGTLPAGAVDGNGVFTPAYEKGQAEKILNELVAALRSDYKAKVQGIPLAADMQTSDVNAYAGCDNGSAFMAITYPLLRAAGHIAEAKAADDTFGTSRLNTYFKLTADALASGGAVPDPPAGFFTAAEANDPRKLTRQRDIFDEMVAFILGHELAHHYLGHTGCANGTVAGGLDPAKLGRITSNVIPGFNQFNETAADTSGTRSLLDVGVVRASAGQVALTEGGAVLVLQFFASMQALRPETIALGFLKTHPPPQLRIPLVQTTAQQWRAGVGRNGNSSVPFPIPIPLPFPIPGM